MFGKGGLFLYWIKVPGILEDVGGTIESGAIVILLLGHDHSHKSRKGRRSSSSLLDSVVKRKRERRKKWRLKSEVSDSIF